MPSACPACSEPLQARQPHIQLMLHDATGIRFFHSPLCLLDWLETAAPDGPIALLPGGRIERELPSGASRGDALSTVGVAPQRFHDVNDLRRFLAKPENEDWPVGELKRALENEGGVR